jgi:hypothetical protein
MKTLITNELFWDFIECKYRGYLKIETGVVRLPNVAIPALHRSGSEPPEGRLAVRQSRGAVTVPHGSQHGPNVRHRSIQLVCNRTMNIS